MICFCVAGLVCLAAVVILCEARFERHFVHDAATRKATCLDGSPAAYFLHLNPNNTASWVFYLMGGGACVDPQSCADFPQKSTNVLPTWMEGFGLLSNDKDANPALHNASKVFVWYCSGDLWFGDNVFNSIPFHGATIFEAVFSDTILAHAPSSVDEIVLGGESAGGWGGMYHAEYVRSKLPNARLMLYSDSAMWLALLQNQALQQSRLPPGTSLFNVVSITWAPKKPSCQLKVRQLAVATEYPCCLDLLCPVRQGFVPANSTVFIGQAVLDAAVGALVLSQSPTTEAENATEPLSAFYADAILSVVRFSNLSDARNNVEFSVGSTSLPPITTFQPACTLHMLTQVSDLLISCDSNHQSCVRDNKALPAQDRNFVLSKNVGKYVLDYNIDRTANAWENIRIRDRSLKDAVTNWVEKSRAVGWNKMQHFEGLVDDCKGVSCNPTCPEEVSFKLRSSAGNIIPLVVFVIAVCALLSALLFSAAVYDFPRIQARSANATGPVPQLATRFSKSRNLQHDTDVFEGVSIVMTSLSFSTKTREKEKVELLHNITAITPANKLTALMGPSGSGKTTLLDVLAGRRGTGEITGNISFNNIGIRAPGAQKWVRENSGFVMQLADPSVERLTARENLEFAADLRLPSSMSCAKRRARVARVIRDLQMQSFQHVVVGGSGAGTAGLSGGQRRRLAVAVQMLKAPKVLFLDEPTSGLDSTTAFQLLKVLVKLCESGHTALISIHQPRVEMWNLFHQVLVLANGHVVYCGGPHQLAGYMKTLLPTHAEKFEESTNPAHTLLDVLREPVVVETLQQNYVTPPQSNIPETSLELPKYSAFDKVFSLVNRNCRAHKLAPVVGFSLACFLMCLVMGIIFFKRKQPSGVFAGITLATTLPSLLISSYISAVVFERMKVIWLEITDGAYRGWHFVFSLFVEVGFAVVMASFIGHTAVYLLIVPNEWFAVWDWLILVLTQTLANLCHVAVIFIIESAIETPELLKTVTVWYISLVALFSGFMVAYSSAPWVVQKFMQINPAFLMNSIACNVLFSDKVLSCKYTTPDIYCPSSSGNYVLYVFSMLHVDGLDLFFRTLIFFVTALACAVAIAEWNAQRKTTLQSSGGPLTRSVRRASKAITEATSTIRRPSMPTRVRFALPQQPTQTNQTPEPTRRSVELYGI